MHQFFFVLFNPRSQFLTFPLSSFQSDGFFLVSQRFPPPPPRHPSPGFFCLLRPTPPDRHSLIREPTLSHGWEVGPTLFYYYYNNILHNKCVHASSVRSPSPPLPPHTPSHPIPSNPWNKSGTVQDTTGVVENVVGKVKRRWKEVVQQGEMRAVYNGTDTGVIHYILCVQGCLLKQYVSAAPPERVRRQKVSGWLKIKI